MEMLKCVPDTLKSLLHEPQSFPQQSPRRHTPFVCGNKGARQTAKEHDSLPFLPENNIKSIQSTSGSFMCYARALDSTMLPALSEISCGQAKPTQHTRQECQQLMDYAATHLNVIVRCCASDMVLHVDSDATYLVLSKARSRIAGSLQLSNHPNGNHAPFLNEEILIACNILPHFVSSAADSETEGLFYNCQLSIPIRCMLEALVFKYVCVT